MNRVFRLLGMTLALACLLPLAGCFLVATPPPGNGCNGDADCNRDEVCISGACRPDNPASCTGDMRITWDFDGVSGCPSNVEDVVIKVFTPDGQAIHSNPQGDSVVCDRGERAYTNLGCGTYRIQVQAVNAADEFTWTAPHGSVDVVNGQTAAVTADLVPE